MARSRGPVGPATGPRLGGGRGTIGAAPRGTAPPRAPAATRAPGRGAGAGVCSATQRMRATAKEWYKRALAQFLAVCTLLQVVIFDAVESNDDDALLAFSAVHDGHCEAFREQRSARFATRRLKSVPRLSGGNEKWRGAVLFGSASNYGKDHSPPVSGREFFEMFRFDRDHVPELLTALKLDGVFCTFKGSGVKISGEECLLIFLKRLEYPCRLVDLQRIFGRSKGYISMCFNWMLDHLYKNFAVKIVNNIDWTRLKGPVLRRFAAAFTAFGCPIAFLFALIDGTFRFTCRPGGRNSRQKAMYSGHKRGHGFNYQGVTTPGGMIIQCWGPCAGRRHDMWMLRASRLLPETLRFAKYLGRQFLLFGDMGYPRTWPLFAPFKDVVLSPAQHIFNAQMQLVRLPVEWGFGKVLQNFAFFDFKKGVKIGQGQAGKLFQVGCFLTNCHSCFYGNQTPRYFGVETPSLKEYLANC